MKTAEEYLIKHMTPLIQRTELSMASIDDMKNQPEWIACVEAIKEAQQDAVKTTVETCAEQAKAEEYWGDGVVEPKLVVVGIKEVANQLINKI